MHLELDPRDFVPACYLYGLCNRNIGRQSSWLLTICTHGLAMLFAFTIGLGAYYYYHNHYITLMLDEEDLLEISPFCPNNSAIDDLKVELDRVRRQSTDCKEDIRKALDAQESHIQEAIDRALDIYDADKIGMFDYASSYAGGMVCSIPDTYPYNTNMTVTFLNFFRVDILSNADAILQPSNFPGNCFAFQGSTGRMRIKLAKNIRVKSVTIDHPSLDMLEDYQSAPKNFEIYGLDSELDDTGILLGTFTYDVAGRPYQTFDMNTSTTKKYEFLEIKIVSNYGNKDYTCFYRFRAHNRRKSDGVKCEDCSV